TSRYEIAEQSGPLSFSSLIGPTIMTLPTLIIAACFLAFVLVVLLFGGPSVSKSKSRRLAMMKDRHAASTEAVVAAQMRKTIQAASGRGSSLSSLMPRREQMELRLRR